MASCRSTTSAGSPSARSSALPRRPAATRGSRGSTATWCATTTVSSSSTPGIGEGDAETEAWYRPQRTPLPQALAAAGLAIADLDLVVNCHLHFDHCGGNPLLGSTPILAQRTELATARAGDYTFEHLLDHAGSNYQEIDGETEALPGLHVIPTPGHVAGHQSLVVECEDGSVVLAGQSHDTASAWTADALAVTARALGHTSPLPAAPGWIDRLLAFDPKRVVFAHDAAVWEPH